MRRTGPQVCMPLFECRNYSNNATLNATLVPLKGIAHPTGIGKRNQRVSRRIHEKKLWQGQLAFGGHSCPRSQTRLLYPSADFPDQMILVD